MKSVEVVEKVNTFQTVQNSLDSRNKKSQQPQCIVIYMRVLVFCSDEEDGGFSTV